MISSSKLGGCELMNIIDSYNTQNNSRCLENKNKADGIVSVAIDEYGLSQRAARKLFEIGYTRYNRIVNNQNKKKPGGQKSNAVTKEMIRELRHYVYQHLSTEEGFPVTGRRMLRYIQDPTLLNWRLLHKHYMEFKKNQNNNNVSIKSCTILI